MSTTASLIHEFTELPVIKDCLEQKQIATFPTREEYHGACYIASINQTRQCPFPSWFDNDWFVFQEWRGRGVPVTFLKEYVLHQSTRKCILDQNFLELEEKGKILNAVHELTMVRGYKAHEAIGRAIEERREIIKRLIDLLARLESCVRSKGEVTAISTSITQLCRLLTKLANLSEVSVAGSLEAYYECQKRWRAWFEHLSPEMSREAREQCDWSCTCE
jgi:hypothetical protein